MGVIKEFVSNPYFYSLRILFTFWKGTLLQFSGLNASRFYFLAKQNIIDWKIFDTVTLSRFDIYYSRENNKQDKISSADFLENCYKKIKQTSKNVTLEKNRRGLILKIGNRKSNNYSRIYQEKNSLKFEYEMKGRCLEKSYNLLVLNNFEWSCKNNYNFTICRAFIRRGKKKKN